MADNTSSWQVTFDEKRPQTYDMDRDPEKGGCEPTSDFEAATIVPDESIPVTRDGAVTEKSSDEEEKRDPNIVDWDGPDDPENPMNWPMKKKWMNIAVLSILTIIT